MAKEIKERTIVGNLIRFILLIAILSGLVFVMGEFLSYILARSLAFVLAATIVPSSISKFSSIAAKNRIKRTAVKNSDDPKYTNKWDVEYVKAIEKTATKNPMKIETLTAIPNLDSAQLDKVRELYANAIVSTPDKSKKNNVQAKGGKK